MSDRDWRLPENRREAFQRFYSFHLKYRSHPGCVYFMLPALAETLLRSDDLDDRAWVVWLNGNTQNPVTTQLLLEAAPHPEMWQKAVDFWNENFKDLEWDTDRRHQKSKFGEATEKWIGGVKKTGPGEMWLAASKDWDGVWEYAFSHPYMGRLSAWSMTEYARIMLPGIPDAATFLLHDKTGSQSHRNGLALIAGYDSVYWPPEAADMLGIVGVLEQLGEDLLQEARERNPGHPDVSRLTLESALCTYKSWHKPNRRYPTVYADMHYERIRRAEKRFGHRFQLQWAARASVLPPHLLLEETLTDPGLTSVKQNHYLETGEPIMLDREWPDMQNGFNDSVAAARFGHRKAS